MCGEVEGPSRRASRESTDGWSTPAGPAGAGGAAAERRGGQAVSECFLHLTRRLSLHASSALCIPLPLSAFTVCLPGLPSLFVTLFTLSPLPYACICGGLSARYAPGSDVYSSRWHQTGIYGSGQQPGVGMQPSLLDTYAQTSNTLPQLTSARLPREYSQ